MKRLTSTILLALISITSVFAEQAVKKKNMVTELFDGFVYGFVEPVVLAYFEVGGVKIPFIILWLLLGALIFTIYFKFINFRSFILAFRIVKGTYSSDDDEGEVTHFQALTAALSGTVGLGNIAGVAAAISLGGPGATFWMILTGLLGMSSKFVECTLGVKYRKIDEDGTVHGGPMYYLSNGIAGFKPGIAGFGKFLAGAFAVFCVFGSFGGGNMFQSNQAYKQMASIGVFEHSTTASFIFGLLMAVLVGVVIIGGIKSIAKVTDKIVPFMVVIYVAAALYILFAKFDQIPTAFMAIIDGAFNAEAAFGGFIGVMIVGIQRAAFSNEAGIGSASIAHSAVKTRFPASEGIVALLEPFIDTVVVCTMTAVVLIITGFYDAESSVGGIEVTSSAFASVIPGAQYIIMVAAVLFAFSTMISWSYYGLQAWGYLFGVSKRNELLYKGIFCIFVVVGAMSSMGAVITFSDCAILAMCFPNIMGLYLLLPIVKDELQKFLAYIKDK